MNLAEREINFKRYTKKPSLNYTSVFLTAQSVCNYFHPADYGHIPRGRDERIQSEREEGGKNAYAPVLYIANENLSENSGGRCDAFETRDRICNLYRCFIARTTRGVGIFLHAFFPCKYGRFRVALDNGA